MRADAPDLVVNAAAYTAVDRAESEPAAAMAVNRDGAAALAAAAAAAGAPVLHVSTDYVFDGAKGAPYAEDDAPAPIGAYGRSKLEGEAAVLAAANGRAADPPHLLGVLRHRAELPAHHAAPGRHARRGLRGGRPARRADLRGRPGGAPSCAMAPRLVASPAGDAAFGVFHLSGAPDTTWHGFAAAVFAGAAARGHRAPTLRAIPTSAYPTPTRRPADSRLDCSRIAAVHGIRRPDWRPALERCLDELLGPAARRGRPRRRRWPEPTELRDRTP